MCLPHRSTPPPPFFLSVSIILPAAICQPAQTGSEGMLRHMSPPQSAAASLSLRCQHVSRTANDITLRIAGKTAGFLASSEKGIQVKNDSWQCDENKGFDSASGIQKINILPAEVFCLSHLAFFNATTKTQMCVSTGGKVSSFKGCTRHVNTWIWISVQTRAFIWSISWLGMMQHKFYLRTKGLSGRIWHLFVSCVCWDKERFL